MGVPFSFKCGIDPKVHKTEKVQKKMEVEGVGQDQSPDWMTSMTQNVGVPSEDLKLFSSVVCNACTLLSLWKCVIWKQYT